MPSLVGSEMCIRDRSYRMYEYVRDKDTQKWVFNVDFPLKRLPSDVKIASSYAYFVYDDSVSIYLHSVNMSDLVFQQKSQKEVTRFLSNDYIEGIDAFVPYKDSVLSFTLGTFGILRPHSAAGVLSCNTTNSTPGIYRLTIEISSVNRTNVMNVQRTVALLVDVPKRWSVKTILYTATALGLVITILIVTLILIRRRRRLKKYEQLPSKKDAASPTIPEEITEEKA
eukprot:TRINITY_DN7998_c0_g1_i1.p1 TRINITY_DN7998_c0_g1~~TRINITY_DN7998_c0_g1_i1.p1  ORF type:complete len:226 (+),score=0.85 TRINITY_DN7998_c0_g1_i1:70-747(+)